MRVSVCLATYNGEKFIKEQINSIVIQLGVDDEIVIADDGSTDATLNVIREFKTHVKVIATERVGGVVKNFERVLRCASGDIIILSDQDDVWLPGRVDFIKNALIKSKLVITNGLVVDQNLTPTGKTIFESVGVRSGFLCNLAKNSYIGCCMAFRRELKDLILPFPYPIPWHDWYIGLMAELVGDVYRIDEITLLYRRHGANHSLTGEASKYSFLKKINIRIEIFFAVLWTCWRRWK